MLNKFNEIQERDWRIQYVIETLNKYNSKEVAIYGTGKHTEWLLGEIGLLVERIACLIDPDINIIGKLKFGLPVQRLEEAIAAGVKAIIISSTFEEDIYSRIEHVLQKGVEVIRLYSKEIIDKSKNYIVKQIQKTAKASNLYTFVDRRNKSKQLLIVLAGYKAYLWPFTLERIARYAPSNLDICLVSSGLYSEELADWAKHNKWSYLYTTINEVSLAQNLAILEHPEAEWIYKLDEDMFITNQYFENLLLGYKHIEEEGLYNPGFVAPIININGYTYIEFLKVLGLEKEYKRVFGELKYAANGIKCHYDPVVAQWIWKNSLPLEEIGLKFSSKSFSYSVVPHRFSIGAILLKREYWESIGGFKIGKQEGVLGIDEEDLCRKCMEYSRVMCIIHNVFCGHFSFFLQEEGMKEFLHKNTKLFELIG